MANNKKTDKISDELIAAFLEGNVNGDEAARVLDSLKNDSSLRDTLEIALNIDKDESGVKDGYLPMAQMAAESNENLCCVDCGAYILDRHGIKYSKPVLVNMARENNWLTDKGTPLYAVGQLIVSEGLMVTRTYDATLADIEETLVRGGDVIVVVDSDKLNPLLPDEEDKPNHAVVVTDISKETHSLTIYNPQDSASKLQRVSITDFMSAWHESRNYMVCTIKSIDEYRPRPINLDNIRLTGDLLDLREAIAENAHNVWALARINEGWTYGPVRDDAKKQHPDLIPYSALSGSEKEYDRLMAMNTIKLVQNLGFEIVKKSK